MGSLPALFLRVQRERHDLRVRSTLIANRGHFTGQEAARSIAVAVVTGIAGRQLASNRLTEGIRGKPPLAGTTSLIASRCGNSPVIT